MIDRAVEPAEEVAALNGPASVRAAGDVSIAERADGTNTNGRRQTANALAVARDYLVDLRRRTGAAADAPVAWLCGDEWYTWTGRRWRAVPAKHQRDRLVRFIQQQGGTATDRLVDSALLNLRGLTLLDEPDVEPPLYVHRVEPLDVEPRPALAMHNGMLDLTELAETGQPRLMPSDPRYLTTTYLPYRFDPRATCPRWERCVQEMFPREHERDHRREVLQEIAAYMLIGKCWLEKKFVFVGEGSNGKTTTLDVLEAMLGRANVSHVGFDELGERFRLNALRGKLANVSREANPLKPPNEALIKAIISGEPVNVDRKHRDSRDLRLNARLVTACNKLPRLTDTSFGMWRRLVILPFNERFVGERDVQDLAEQLIQQELPGILNWALAAVPRLVQRGRLTDCDCCDAVLAQHRQICDPVEAFLAACCRRAPNMGIEREKLYKLYVHFCRTRLERGVTVLGQPQFGEHLHKAFDIGDGRRSRPRPDGRRPRLYTGIALSPEGEELLETEVLGTRVG